MTPSWPRALEADSSPWGLWKRAAAPAADRQELDALGHVRVDDARDALGGGERVGAERLGQRRDGALGGGHVEADAAAEEVAGIEQAAHEIGVGHRGRGAAAAIPGGT